MKLCDSLMLAAELIRQSEISRPISQFPTLGAKEFRSKTGGKGCSAKKIKSKDKPHHATAGVKFCTEAVETFVTAGELCRGWAAQELLQ